MPFTGLFESSFEWSVLILGPLFLITKTTSQKVRSLIGNIFDNTSLFFTIHDIPTSTVSLNNGLWDHLFRMYAKSSKKLKFFTH